MSHEIDDPSLARLDWPAVIDAAVQALRFEIGNGPGAPERRILAYADDALDYPTSLFHAVTALIELHKLLVLPTERHGGLFPATAARVKQQRQNLLAAMQAGTDRTLTARIYARGLGDMLKTMVAEGGYQRVLAWGTVMPGPISRKG